MNKQNNHLTIKDIPRTNKYQIIKNKSPKNWSKANILNERHTDYGNGHLTERDMKTHT